MFKPQDIYHAEVPAFIADLAAQPTMQRLKQVGMNCGCEYTSFRRFQALQPASRYDHSVGTALIVWHFTKDKKQAVAALLHDIATPAFSHVIDFLNGDHLRQESTEAGTEAVVRSLQPILAAMDLKPEEVDDYHLYPIADNPAPRLSADRLEYTMSNLYNYGMASMTELNKLYAQICVGKDEQGNPELVFMQPMAALQFARGALDCSQIYVSPEDRYAMQRLAELLKVAISRGALRKEQLYSTETEVISCLRKDSFCHGQWQAFCACSDLQCRNEKPAEAGWLQVSAKKRYIDPMIDGMGRVSEVFPAFKHELIAFLKQEQAQWMKGFS